MPKNKKNEQVSLSVHYVVRTRAEDDHQAIPITSANFQTMYEHLTALKKQDPTSSEFIERLKFNNYAIIKNVELVNKQTISGIFETSYWGHSFRNSDKGDISAESLNHRPFMFLLYLSDTGKVYIVCQYLGNYGGYLAMKSTIQRMFAKGTTLNFHSFNLFMAQMGNVTPKEVIFDVAKQSTAINGSNIFSQEVMIALKNTGKSADYEEHVKSRILSLFKSPKAQIRSELTKLLRDNALMSINDDELENCRVIARVHNKTITIQMLNESNYATKFPIDVPLKSDGHPEYEPLKTAAIKVLKDQVIARSEDV